MKKLVNIFDEIKNNTMTAVGAKYTDKDLLNVWTEIAKQIVGILKDGKGVIIKGLGTFTLSNWSLETGNNHRSLTVWQPIFLISKSLTEDFDLHQPKQYTNDAVSSTLGNLKTNKNLNLPELEQLVGKLISGGRNVRFPMGRLGNLTIIETRVRFTFYDSCQPRIEEMPKHCTKFPTANTIYTKKFDVPCAGHASTKF